MARYPKKETKDIIRGAVNDLLDFGSPWLRPPEDADVWDHRQHEQRTALFRRKLMILGFIEMLEEMNERFDKVDALVIESCILEMIKRRQNKRHFSI